MTTDTASPIEYATDNLEQPADRLLRRIVAGSAIAYGGLAVAGTALNLALAAGLVAGPPDMVWDPGSGWHQGVAAAQTVAMAASVVGGVLMLGGGRSGVLVVRAAVTCSIVLLVLSRTADMLATPELWSTPAGAAAYATHYLRGFFVPVLIVLLTLPPLARRMR